MKTHYPPKMNTGKNVFVFGSNQKGIHGKGAARSAYLYWGAKRGIGFGFRGQSFAIPTKASVQKSLTIPVIRHYVDEFLDFARRTPELTFLVTPIGTGFAGFTHDQMAPLFKGYPENCVMPLEWKELL